MNELVTLKGNDIFTDSLVISIGAGVRHDKVKESIRKYKTRVEKFGRLSPPHKGESTGGRPEEVYQLNEQQATFIITLMKNTDKVLDFKEELVKQFYTMRRFILERQTQSWIETRQQGKITRKSETDVIQQLVGFAKEQGSENSDKLYITYSKLANKIAGISKRDEASIMQLNNLSLIENIILNCIQVGMAMDKHYKEIYKDCKRRLETFKDIAYLETA